jgi:hypothetical protein
LYYMSDNEAEREPKGKRLRRKLTELKTKRKMNQKKIMKRENQRVE